MTEYKVCTKCGIEKPLNEYYKNKRAKDGYAYYCRKCISKRKKEYYQKNKDKIKKYQKDNKEKIKEQKNYYKYNLISEDYNIILEQQQNMCAICDCDFTLMKSKNICVDHCHTTGTVRGLLCRKCNIGIGYFEDNIGILKKTIKYLEKYKNRKV